MYEDRFEWYAEDHIVVVYCPADLNSQFFQAARKFVVALDTSPIYALICGREIVEMPADFMENIKTKGILAYRGVERVAYCEIPSGWDLTLTAANRLISQDQNRVSFHRDVESAYMHLKSLSDVTVS